MIDLPTPRETPDRYPYIVVELAERGDHHLRIPSMPKVARLVKQMKQTHILLLVAMAQAKTTNDSKAASMMTAIKEGGPELTSAAGALIGIAWFHRQRVMVTEAPKRNGDWLEYGEAIYEELHEEGYTLSEIGSLALTIMRAMWEHSQLTDEVQARAGFIYPILGAMSSSVSTSESTTSETPTDSPN